MSSTRKTSTNDPAVLTYRQIAKTWDVMNTSDWLSIPGIADLKFRENKPDDLVGLCPNPQHSDSNPSFHIYTKERHGYCFGCGYRPINPIELIANIQRTSHQDAFHYLCKKIPNLPFSKAKALSQLNTQQTIQLAKTTIIETCHDQLVKAIQSLVQSGAVSTPTVEAPDWDNDGEPGTFTREDVKQSLKFNKDGRAEVKNNVGIGYTDFAYAKPLVDWLINARKIPVETIPSLPIGIFPPYQVLVNLILHTYNSQNPAYRFLGGADYTGAEVAAAAQKFLTENGNAIGFSCAGALVFPLYRTPTHIAAIKTRNPSLQKQQSFHIFSDPFEDDIGIFGLNFAPYVAHHAPLDRLHNYAVIVEGEFDALQPMVHAIQTGKVLHPIYSAGGTGGSNSLEEVLQLNGIKNAYFMGDSPTKGLGGETVVELWASRISRVAARVFSSSAWEKLNPAGDLDECYTSPTVGPELVEEVLSDLANNFTALWKWAADRASEHIARYGEDDKRGRMDAAAEAGKYLLNIFDISLYAEQLSTIFPQLNPNVLKRELHSKVDSELGFIHRVSNALSDLFEPVAVSGDGQDRSIEVYNKEKAELTSIRLDSEQGIVTALSPYTGSLHGFIGAHVGYPPFLISPDETNSLIMQAQDKKLRFYAKEAVLQLSQGLPDMSNLRKLRNGYHHLGKTPGQTPQEYIINGQDLVHITRDSDGRPVFKLCTSPRCNDVLNDNDAKDLNARWWFNDDHLTPEVLNVPRNDNLLETYEKLCQIFDVGFGFEHQEVTVKLLAALTLTYPIMTAFQRQTLVTLSADTNTGKSSLMHILSGENSPDSYDPTRLLMMSRKWDNYTVPGVMNSAVGETLLYNLDEFEHKSDARGSRVESLAEAVRQLTKGTASKVMGTNIPGETRTLNYFLPFMFANIAGATKAQDINRLIQICMRKEPLRGSPSSNILKKFTAKELRRMRYSVNFGAIHHVPKILEHYNRIQTQYSEINSKLNNPVDERLMSSFYSVFSVMEHLGVDWIKFFKEYTDCNSTIIDRGSSTNESDDIMNSILFNPVIKLPGMDKDSRACSLSEIIVSREKRTLLNFSGDGVYFDEDTRLILFNLPTVIERLLPKSIKYSDKLTSLTLRNILERHEKAVSPRDVPSLGIISKAAPVIGAGLKAQNVVVLRVDSWLEEYASNVAEYVSPEEAEVSTTPEEDKIAYEYN